MRKPVGNSDDNSGGEEVSAVQQTSSIGHSRASQVPTKLIQKGLDFGEQSVSDAEALADARNWILVTVAADVARAYLDMRALQRELAVLRENIKVAKDL